MYVAQFLRVSLLVPLIFRNQSNQVKNKRQCYEKTLTIVNVCAYIFLAARSILYFSDRLINNHNMVATATVTMIILTLALCLALRKIRNFTNNLVTEGIISSERLILAHQTSFIMATLLMVLNLTLFLIKEDSKSVESDPTQSYRITIAMIYIDLLLRISWFFVNILMLRIFTKYGKPLQEDE